MKPRLFVTTFSLFGLGASLALGAGALATALQQAFDPYSPQWLWAPFFWLLCLATGPLLAAYLHHKKISARITIVLGAVLACVFLILAPGILDRATTLYMNSGNGLVAGLIVAFCLAPACLGAGTMLGGVRRQTRSALIPMGLGAALAGWYSPSLLLSILGSEPVLLTGGILIGSFGGAIALVSERVENDFEPCIWSRAVLAHLILGGVLTALVGLSTIRLFVPLVAGYLPALWLVPVVLMASISIGALLYSVKPKYLSKFPNGTAVALLFLGLYTGMVCLAGDGFAMFFAMLRPLGSAGISGNLVAWMTYALAAALLPGIALGLYLALLGRQTPGKGEKEAGTSLVFLGVALGFLFFGLTIVQGIGAVNILKLAGLASFAGFIHLAIPKGTAPQKTSIHILAILGGLLLLFPGPGPIWKHGGIGAGRMDIFGQDKNNIADIVNGVKKGLAWETETPDGYFGIDDRTGLLLMNNGSAGKHSRYESFSRGMLGILSSLLHPDATNALILGFKNGYTPAWLATVDGIEKIDVAATYNYAENLPESLHTLHEQALKSPKVRFTNQGILASAVEAKGAFDIVISAPGSSAISGNSRLYSNAFYKSLAQKTTDRGIFVQYVRVSCWDSRSLSILYSALCSAFPSVQTWILGPDELVIVCRKKIQSLDLVAMEKTIHKEPYQSYLARVWGVTDVEGLLARFVATDHLARLAGKKAISRGWTPHSFESEFSRAWARPSGLKTVDIINAAWEKGFHRPRCSGLEPDWEAVDHNRLLVHALYGDIVPGIRGLSPMNLRKLLSYNTLLMDNRELFYARQERHFRSSPHPYDMFTSGSVLAENGSSLASEQADRLSAFWPCGAMVNRAEYLWRTGSTRRGLDLLTSCVERIRQDPLVHPAVVRSTLGLAVNLSKEDALYAGKVIRLLEVPFFEEVEKEERLKALQVASTAWNEPDMETDNGNG